MTFFRILVGVARTAAWLMRRMYRRAQSANADDHDRFWALRMWAVFFTNVLAYRLQALYAAGTYHRRRC